MGWVRDLFTEEIPVKVEERHISLDNPRNTFGSWVSSMFNVSSSTVKQDEVFGLSAVWRAIKILAESVASLPLNVYEQKDNGDVVPLYHHPVNYLIEKEPSKFYTSFIWRETSMTHLLVTGNSYNEKIYDGAGNIAEIRMIDPGAINDIFLRERGLEYHITGRNKPIFSEDIIHVPGLSYNGFVGKNPIEVHRESLQTDRDSRDYIKNIYANGAFLSGTLDAPGPLSDTAYDRIKNSWNKSFGGAENAGKTPVLEEGVKFTPLKLSPIDVAWIETRKNVIEEVARIFGVPMHMLQALDRATFNNIEYLSIEFTKYTLRPWLRRWEDELNRKLFNKKEQGRFFVMFDMSDFYRGDLSSMAEWISTHYNMGTLTRNEIRRKHLNLPGLEHGDIPLVQGNNMMPVDRLIAGDQLKLNI